MSTDSWERLQHSWTLNCMSGQGNGWMDLFYIYKNFKIVKYLTLCLRFFFMWQNSFSNINKWAGKSGCSQLHLSLCLVSLHAVLTEVRLSKTTYVATQLPVFYKQGCHQSVREHS